MAIRETITRSKGRNICDTVVSVGGMKITIGVNECVYGGQPEVLDDEYEHDVQEIDEKIHLGIWLVKLQDTGELTILADECLAGTQAYKWGDSNMKPIFPLVTANIPPSVTDLESSDILVHKCLSFPTESGAGESDG